MKRLIVALTFVLVIVAVSCTNNPPGNPGDRIKGEGEICGGIAGFMCEEGLTCKMEGDYPDAAGICIKTGKNQDCPQLMPPGPDFCPNGTIKPNYDESKCIRGYSCEKNEEKKLLDDSCNVGSDCEVKNVGNCCGYYPKCLNKDAATDPEAVKADCQEKGMASVCGFPEIESCSCVDGKCVAN